MRGISKGDVKIVEVLEEFMEILSQSRSRIALTTDDEFLAFVLRVILRDTPANSQIPINFPLPDMQANNPAIPPSLLTPSLTPHPQSPTISNLPPPTICPPRHLTGCAAKRAAATTAVSPDPPSSLAQRLW